MSTTTDLSASRNNVVRKDTPEAIYQALGHYLQKNGSAVLSIEILPSSHELPADSPPFLQDGIAVGIPKRALRAAYFVARRQFVSALQYPIFSEGVSLEEQHSGCRASEEEDLNTASKILLLHTPEHVTACNYRKRRLQRLFTSCSTVRRPARGVKITPSLVAPLTISLVVQHELAFLTSILTSPLPVHAKSPTLFYHRLWLIREYLAYFVGPSHASKLNFYFAELRVVLQAAARHKGNYHTFLYGRKLLELLESKETDSTSFLQVNEAGMEKQEGSTLDVGIIWEVHAWCLAHPRDISGWTFLAYLLERYAQVEPSVRTMDERPLGETHVGSAVGDESHAPTVRRQVLQKTRAFVRDLMWAGKTVEWFLRAMEVGQGGG
ncbi:hypothetical protein MMC25_005378 [Agyrium rufum]|nr:hypothetical protein [Agyrium rufum]